MMLTPQQNLKDKIVLILSQEGSVSAEDVLQYLKNAGTRATLQGIYRALRALLNGGVITKEKQNYSLRIPWILDLSSLVDKMEKTYLQQTYLQRFIPKEDGDRKIWHFNDILKMNNFWSQMLLTMAHATKSKIALTYCPHIWFEITQKYEENQYRRTYLKMVKQYSIIGSRSFLDKYTLEQGKKFKNEERYMASAEEKIFKDPSIYIDVVGDLVLTIKLDKKTTDHVENIYSKIDSKESMRSFPMVDLLLQKTNIKMILKKDAKKASYYRNKFKKIFGFK